MKIEDLIQLLNNRSREFQLSRDYARMSGDLERMNAADKEIIALEDTLYQLNLLVDVSKSATVKEAILAEAITDGSVAVLSEYDITPYATDPLHEEKIMNILSKMAVMDTVEKVDNYIKGKYPSSPVTGDMVMSAAGAYSVDQRLMMAIMEQDSRFGTAGLAIRTINPGNVGNDDSGNTRTYDSWQEGVTAVAEWLSRHRISREVPMETFIESVSTSTPSTLIPTATSTPPTLLEGEVGAGVATSTPLIFPTITSTSNPPLATSTPSIATSTPETIIPVTNSTTTTTTLIPTLTTATSTPPTLLEEGVGAPTESVGATVATSTTTTTLTPTLTTATSSPETIIPVTNSTTTQAVATTSAPLESNEASSISNGAGTATSTIITSTTTPTTATSTAN
jgi:hypothetical protein